MPAIRAYQRLATELGARVLHLHQACVANCPICAEADAWRCLFTCLLDIGRGGRLFDGASARLVELRFVKQGRPWTVRWNGATWAATGPSSHRPRRLPPGIAASWLPFVEGAFDQLRAWLKVRTDAPPGSPAELLDEIAAWSPSRVPPADWRIFADHVLARLRVLASGELGLERSTPGRVSDVAGLRLSWQAFAEGHRRGATLSVVVV